jgi:hypothetical protein
MALEWSATLIIAVSECAGHVESNSLEEALQGFQEVLKMEEQKGEWCTFFTPRDVFPTK